MLAAILAAIATFKMILFGENDIAVFIHIVIIGI
jgi:hypothetical protein